MDTQIEKEKANMIGQKSLKPILAAGDRKVMALKKVKQIYLKQYKPTGVWKILFSSQKKATIFGQKCPAYQLRHWLAALDTPRTIDTSVTVTSSR